MFRIRIIVKFMDNKKNISNTSDFMVWRHNRQNPEVNKSSSTIRMNSVISAIVGNLSYIEIAEVFLTKIPPIWRVEDNKGDK